jgi:serine/threonine-protein kinase
MQAEIETLFHALADLSPAEREEEFAKRCTPPDVRAEVEAMLSFDSGPDHSLTESVADAAQTTLHSVAETQVATRCGPYLLIRLLGRGGMGSVYLAERADGEVNQRVAVKLLSYGADDPAFRERFLRERQILATLNHAGIARLVDAGHIPTGQPYLVMEYVDGMPIDEYAGGLDLRAKLKLFLEVCDAVSYAHRNLVIHRDLKPSNILVDRDGRPKLLDFGIAKILDPSHSASQERTMTAVQALTPQYASPEQVRGEPITTATDVYSLGAVLYKLLTSRYPYEFPVHTASAVEHTVCEMQPAPPRVSADLDTILLMALRKEPARRYLSVQQFAEDIDRAISDRPVRARPDTMRYRTAKFIRRHRFGVAGASLAVAALIAAVGIAAHEASLAERQLPAGSQARACLCIRPARRSRAARRIHSGPEYDGADRPGISR